jgi:uncharacterized protein
MTTRDSFPDVLRGFALFGIALVNIPLLAVSPVLHNEGADLTIFANSAAAFVVMALFQAKFYLLFSFLFGYSSHYVLRDSRENRGRWVGRSVGLILLGIAHFSLLFFGDILFVYGVFGLVLLAFYFRSEKTQRVWAWVIYGVSAFVFAAAAALTILGEQFLALKGKDVPDFALDDFSRVMTTDSFVDSIGPRLELWLTAAPSGLLLQGPLVLVAFLVGVIAARRKALGNSANPSVMRKMAVWGLAIGLPLQLASAFVFINNAVAETYSYGLFLSSLALNFLTAPILSAGYVGLLWIVSQKRQLGILSSAGKYSLTIYLSQSVVFATLFSGWGFGLFGQLDVTAVTLIAASTWIVLATLAHLVALTGRKGPLETLLTKFSSVFRTR